MGMVDPLARLWYVARTGNADRWIPELGLPIVTTLVSVTSALGFFVMISVYLAFFPTRGFRSWVEARAASSNASTNL